MSPSRAGKSFLLVLLATPSSAAGGVLLEVGGGLRVQDAALEVRVDLINRGDAPAAELSVEGELAGNRDRSSLPGELAPQATRSVFLRFPLELPRPGVHAVDLHLRYVGPRGSAQRESVSQRAYLLLAIGANPGPAVRMFLDPLSLNHQGAMRVGLESADGRPHQVRLRALTPQGLNFEEPGPDVQVPEQGRVTAELRLLRAGAPRGSRAGVVVLARATDGPLERTAAATEVVEVAPDPAWMPRLRRPLIVLALVLMAGAAGLELRRVRARRAG